MVKQMPLKEAFEHLKKENFKPDHLVLQYNKDCSRAKVILKGAPIQISNFLKVEKANKIIDDYKDFCGK